MRLSMWLAVVVGGAALICQQQHLWGTQVAVPSTTHAVPAFVAMMALLAVAAVLAWLIKVLLAWLVALVGASALGAWYWCNKQDLWGVQVAIPWDTHATVSAFEATMAVLLAGFLLLVVLMMLFRARFRLMVLGWALNRAM